MVSVSAVIDAHLLPWLVAAAVGAGRVRRVPSCAGLHSLRVLSGACSWWRWWPLRCSLQTVGRCASSRRSPTGCCFTHPGRGSGCGDPSRCGGGAVLRSSCMVSVVIGSRWACLLRGLHRPGGWAMAAGLVISAGAGISATVAPFLILQPGVVLPGGSADPRLCDRVHRAGGCPGGRCRCRWWCPSWWRSSAPAVVLVSVLRCGGLLGQLSGCVALLVALVVFVAFAAAAFAFSGFGGSPSCFIWAL